MPSDAFEGFDSIFYTSDRHSPVFDEILEKMVSKTRPSGAKESIGMKASANVTVEAKPRTVGNGGLQCDWYE